MLSFHYQHQQVSVQHTHQLQQHWNWNSLLRHELGADLLQAPLPPLLQTRQLFLVQSLQTLQMLQMNSPHLIGLMFRLLHVRCHRLGHKQKVTCCQSSLDSKAKRSFQLPAGGDIRPVCVRVPTKIGLCFTINQFVPALGGTCSQTTYLKDVVQTVQLPLKRVTENRGVVIQLGRSSLTENRPPAFVQLQQVHLSVSLLLLQLVLLSTKSTSMFFFHFYGTRTLTFDLNTRPTFRNRARTSSFFFSICFSASAFCCCRSSFSSAVLPPPFPPPLFFFFFGMFLFFSVVS